MHDLLVSQFGTMCSYAMRTCWIYMRVEIYLTWTNFLYIGHVTEKKRLFSCLCISYCFVFVHFLWFLCLWISYGFCACAYPMILGWWDDGGSIRSPVICCFVMILLKLLKHNPLASIHYWIMQQYYISICHTMIFSCIWMDH